MNNLGKRLEALENEQIGRFTGYAVLMVRPEQTVEEAQAEWIAENGPVGTRQWVVFNFGGDCAAA